MAIDLKKHWNSFKTFLSTKPAGQALAKGGVSGVAFATAFVLSQVVIVSAVAGLAVAGAIPASIIGSTGFALAASIGGFFVGNIAAEKAVKKFLPSNTSDTFSSAKTFGCYVAGFIIPAVTIVGGAQKLASDFAKKAAREERKTEKAAPSLYRTADAATTARYTDFAPKA